MHGVGDAVVSGAAAGIELICLINFIRAVRDGQFWGADLWLLAVFGVRTIHRFIDGFMGWTKQTNATVYKKTDDKPQEEQK